jgi:1-acyl-sn-glycerol-3-phosphate acyltransferase
MPPEKVLLPSRSPALIRWFIWYVRRYQVRPFLTAVRLAEGGKPRDLPGDRAVVVVLNHASWWDPLLCMIAQELLPGRRHYAPIDARMLEKYGIFRKLGFFGIEPGTAKGAIQFLRTGQAILQQPDSALWITAQGEFADVRRRPIQLRRGLGHLLARCPQVAVYPLAIEYVFWNEKRPEALLSFGPPVANWDSTWSAEAITSALADALAATMDRLAEKAISRQPAAFQVLCGGTTGISRVYDTWRSFTHWLRGQRFQPGHEASSSTET